MFAKTKDIADGQSLSACEAEKKRKVKARIASFEKKYKQSLTEPAEVEYINFPKQFEYIMWMQAGSVRYINTGYSHDPEDAGLWLLTKDSGIVRIDKSEKLV